MSLTQLSAITPAHTAGIVNIVVTNPDNTTFTYPNSYTYLPPCTYISSNTDSACINLSVNTGVLSIDTPTTVDFDEITVSSNYTDTQAYLFPVTITDSRGAGTGWSASCKLSNFQGQSDSSSVIKLADTLDSGDSRFNLTSTDLTSLNINQNALDGLYDYAQDTQYLSSLEGGGESNDFYLSGFAVDYGYCSFQKDLYLSLSVPPFIKAQGYTSVMTCSVG